MDQIKIGKFIAVLRKEKGLTQEQLGEKLGVTNKTVSRWENGNYMPDVEMLSLLSKEFGVSINELISGERLLAEDFKKAADDNLVTALNNSTFTLKEKIAFFKKKWLHEHISTIVLCVVAWIGIIIWTALKLRGSDSYALLGAIGSMLAILCLFHINRRPNPFFIEICEIELAVTITMLCGTLRPIKRLIRVLLHTDPVIEKVAHLTFGKGIALLSKFHVSFKALLKLLCVPVFLDQFIATVKLRTWFIISFCHLQYLNQIISFRYAWVRFLSSQKESHKYISILNRIGKTKALLYPELLRSNMFHLYRSRDSAGREFPLQILNTELYRL